MKKGAYYNEFDPNAAAWLRELIKDGLLPDGEVDERSIIDVQPEEVKGFLQCGFFTGIGGWSRALQLAGWPEDQPVWHGSPPCQPFSCAGKGKGDKDERHLWPEFRRLIDECRPPAIFGEQVASKAGREWLSGVRLDLEAMGYAVGAADLCAAGVGAPHIRQRLFWGAVRVGNTKLYGSSFARQFGESGEKRWVLQPQRSGCRLEKPGLQPEGRGLLGPGESISQDSGQSSEQPERSGINGRRGRGEPADDSGVGNMCEPGLEIGQREAKRQSPGLQFERHGGWSNSRLISCRDGKVRRIPAEPVFQPLANGLLDSLGSTWGSCIDEIKEKVNRYAAKSKRSTREVLQEMWGIAGEKEIQREIGRLYHLSAPRILHLALCELDRQEGRIPEGSLQRIQETEAGPLHEMRSDSGELETTAHASQGWGLEEQRSDREELRNLVYELSHKASQLTAVRNIVEATECFPVSHGIPGRVGLLRGAGNAIVPQVAAIFIEEFRRCFFSF